MNASFRLLLPVVAALLLVPGAARSQDAEPNDTFEQATPISCNSTFLGSLGGSDPGDFYLVQNLPVGAILQIDVTSVGSCVGGTSPGAPCAAFDSCPGGGLCAKPIDMDLVGYDADRVEIFFLDEPFVDDSDPVGTIPLRNTAPIDVYLEIFPFGSPPAAETYELRVSCLVPEPLNCPRTVFAGTNFELEFPGELDVFRIDLDEPLSAEDGPRRVSLDVDAEDLALSTPALSAVDTLIRLYDANWNLISESADALAPDETVLIPGESTFDSYIRAFVYDSPGTYYLVVTCGEDFDFLGCPDAPLGTFEDFEYRLVRQCTPIDFEPNHSNGTPLATLSPCTPEGTFISEEIPTSPFTTGTEVDYYYIEASPGDLVEVDIDTVPDIDPQTPNLQSVVGLFFLSGYLADGKPLLLEDEPLCDFETTACNDDGIAPDDTVISPDDSYLTFCAPVQAPNTPLAVSVSNEFDLDFNGLDDLDNTFDEDMERIIGPYDITIRCSRPDLDADEVTDCLDNCPGAANPDQADADGDGIGDACEDDDGDLVPNLDDNCPNVSNADQADTDQNGIGDACQCGDVNGDGTTNVTDALAIARGEVLSNDPNFGKCDVNGDTTCNVTDALQIARGEVSSDPLAQLCPAYQGGGA